MYILSSKPLENIMITIQCGLKMKNVYILVILN